MEISPEALFPKNYRLNYRSIAGANMRLKRSESGTDTNLDANGRCIADRNWKEDCNDCWCLANGVPACTLKGCVQIPVDGTPTPETDQSN